MTLKMMIPMQLTIEFILKLTLFWLVSLLVYHLLLRKLKHLNVNRLFLLLSLWLGPVLLSMPIINYEPIYVHQLLGGTITAGAEAVAGPLAPYWSIWQMMLLIGIGVGVVRLLFSLLQFYQTRAQATKEVVNGWVIYRLSDSQDCYTFFGCIIIGNEVPQEDLECMIAHEVAHQRLGHSWDILLLEIMTIVFWFHPLVYVYRSFLVELHEYQADQDVLQSFSIKYYGHLLVQHALKTRVSLFHKFSNQSLLKKRLTMLTNYNKMNNNLWRYGLGLPLLFAFALLLQGPKIQAQTTAEPDEYPVYGQCEGTKDEVKQCSNKNLFTAIGQHFKYPKSTQEAKREGKVLIQFVVGKNGRVRDAKILKSLDKDSDAEALRVVKLLNGWQAGKKDGQKVPVKLTLPIAFRLK